MPETSDFRFGLYLGTGQHATIAQGSILYQRRSNDHPVTPWTVKELNRRRMVLKCACGDPRCTRTETWTAKLSGQHPA